MIACPPFNCWCSNETCAVHGCQAARQSVLAPTGWTCPACGKGNAPDVKGCTHCAQVTITCKPPWGDDNEIRRAGDVPKEKAI